MRLAEVDLTVICEACLIELIVKEIHIERGAWIGAGAWVGPGVRVGSHAVLTACSVAPKDLEPFGIYQGNPAEMRRRRTIESR